MDDPRATLSVAITGNIASGKSTVLRAWSREGVPVISADQLAREVVEPGTDGLREVVRAFGEEVIGPDGGLDRRRLRDRIFRDEVARRRLESLLHPRIRGLREQWLREQRRGGEALVAAEIPLLFETGYDAAADITIVVHAPAEVRLDRLVRLRGLDVEEATRIMDTQKNAEETFEMAHHVIRNDGAVADLERRALEVLTILEGRAEREREC